MNKKQTSALVFGLIATQFVAPSFDASEVTQPVVEQAVVVNYAPTNATRAQVKVAAPTDLVVFTDSALEASIAAQLGVAVGEITVANMGTLDFINCPSGNISNITGLEYAVNATGINLADNKITNLAPVAGLTKLVALDVTSNSITDITPIAGLTNLATFSATNNQIKSIAPMAGLTKIEYTMLEGNMIDDISPLSGVLNSGILEGAHITGQTINLPDKTVANTNEVTYDIVSIDSAKQTVSLGTPAKGVNNLTGNSEFDVNGIISYSATVNQKVTVAGMTASGTVEVNEGTALTDAELIALFNVQAETPADTTVDQATVNYDKPDTYNVVFTNGTETVTSILIVKDVAPVITLTNTTVTLTVGDKAPDYLTVFGPVATEFTTGDLTATITVDDSAVNYSKAGTYKVTFTVTDADGTVGTKQGSVVVKAASVVTPEKPITEEPTTETGTKTPTTETGTKTTTNTTTDTIKQVTAMTDGNKKSLSKTGNNTVMILSVYTMILTMILTVKKTMSRKN